MFTEAFMRQIKCAFERRITYLGKGAEQVRRLMERCGSQEREALQCLYASMPASDAADYPPELFSSFAAHGVFLWNKGPFAGQIPEKIFAGYVLHHRVNDEDLTDCRPFFYEQLAERIRGMGMERAALEINYWCAEHASYQTTDDRTAGAMTVFRSGYGRCGEESVFVVTVLRSMGIPARQVYAPLWSHCDDNHAWVEVWCEGDWKFLGACEPEETLNRGWFVSASSRAMMVHSRWFLPVKPGEKTVGVQGMALALNRLSRYAPVMHLVVEVKNQNGSPASDAQVHFEVINYAGFGEIAVVHADENGRAELETGFGSLHVTASGEDGYAETTVDTRKYACGKETDSHGSILLTLEEGEPGETDWEELVFFAPRGAKQGQLRPESVEQEREAFRPEKTRQEQAAALRKKRTDGFYDAGLAERAAAGFFGKERERCLEIMRLAGENQGEIAAFLLKPTEGVWPDAWKMAVLNSLSEKDYLDVTADILEENCRQTAAALQRPESLEVSGRKRKLPEEIFVSYVLCPRVECERLCPFRTFLFSWLGEEKIREIRRQPVRAWRLVREMLKPDPAEEYGKLVTSARGAFLTGYGSALTQRVVCVQILRTAGIPARLNPVDGRPQIWEEGGFHALEKQPECSLFLEKQEGQVWTYFQNWTIARFEGNGYRTLAQEPESGISGEISLIPGTYRILTANRLPNGNLFVRQKTVKLQEGQKSSARLELMPAAAEDMLEENELMDFSLEKEDKSRCAVSELVRQVPGLFIWLEEGKEPTEHILNEIFAGKEKFGALSAGIYLVGKSIRAAEKPTVARVLEALPNAELLTDRFGAEMEALARSMYLEPGRLPLIVLVDSSLTGIYGVAGYNVGTADMLLKILAL